MGHGSNHQPHRYQADDLIKRAGALTLISQSWSVNFMNLRCLFISFLRKEVIQPLVPQRLPCYDFTLIINHTLGTCPPEGLAQ